MLYYIVEVYLTIKDIKDINSNEVGVEGWNYGLSKSQRD